MNKIKPIIFHESHFEFLEMRPQETNVLDVGTFNWIASQGFCNSLVADKKLIAITGFTPRWEGVIQVYVVPSIHVERCAVSFIRTIRTYLKNIAETTPGLKRMETQSLADEQTDRWMHCLGFRCEGTHPNWAKNGDTYRTWSIMVNNGVIEKNGNGVCDC